MNRPVRAALVLAAVAVPRLAVAQQAAVWRERRSVRRVKDGYAITNLDRFERKRVDGMVTITRKGSDQRISGLEVALSSDPPK